MRFLLDENVHHGLVLFLTGLGHDATRSPKGLSNGAVFAAASSAQRILLTHDKDFAEWQPTESHPGVILTDRLVVVFPDRHDEFPFRWEVIPFPPG